MKEYEIKEVRHLLMEAKNTYRQACLLMRALELSLDQADKILKRSQ